GCARASRPDSRTAPSRRVAATRKRRVPCGRRTPLRGNEFGGSPIATAERALIVNADEFGLTEHVNYGIVEAHQHGAVTSTTMLANMWAFEHAAGLARAHPTLAVGVHLNLTHGRPVLPPARVPTLVDQEGHFYRR